MYLVVEMVFDSIDYIDSLLSILIPTNLRQCAVKVFIIVIACTNILEFYMYTIKKDLNKLRIFIINIHNTCFEVKNHF